MQDIKSFFSKNLTALIFIFLIIICVLCIINYENEALVRIKSAGNSFFSIFQIGMSGVSNFFTNTFSSVTELTQVKDELEAANKKLEKYDKLLGEVGLLRNEIARLREEQHYLEEVIPLLYDSNVKQVPAEIIARQPDNFFSIITLNKGEQDGVKPGMPVVAFNNGMQGLMGKVVTVGVTTSLVMPIFNESFYVSVVFRDAQYEGLVNGLGENTDFVMLRYINKKARSEIRYGDIVITSGMGKIYPRGIPVGKVNSIQSKSYETSMEITLEPILDFSRLKNIFIIVIGA